MEFQSAFSSPVDASGVSWQLALGFAAPPRFPNSLFFASSFNGEGELKRDPFNNGFITSFISTVCHHFLGVFIVCVIWLFLNIYVPFSIIFEFSFVMPTAGIANDPKIYPKKGVFVLFGVQIIALADVFSRSGPVLFFLQSLFIHHSCLIILQTPCPKDLVFKVPGLSALLIVWPKMNKCLQIYTYKHTFMLNLVFTKDKPSKSGRALEWVPGRGGNAGLHVGPHFQRSARSLSEQELFFLVPPGNNDFFVALTVFFTRSGKGAPLIFCFVHKRFLSSWFDGGFFLLAGEPFGCIVIFLLNHIVSYLYDFFPFLWISISHNMVSYLNIVWKFHNARFPPILLVVRPWSSSLAGNAVYAPACLSSAATFCHWFGFPGPLT